MSPILSTASQMQKWCIYFRLVPWSVLEQSLDKLQESDHGELLKKLTSEQSQVCLPEVEQRLQFYLYLIKKTIQRPYALEQNLVL